MLISYQTTTIVLVVTLTQIATEIPLKQPMVLSPESPTIEPYPLLNAVVVILTSQTSHDRLGRRLKST
jgi:hypothetical protein